MHTSRSRQIVILTALMSLSSVPVMAQQGPAGCTWDEYLYAQDATKQGKVDTNLLNQMSELVSARGFSLTSKVWQVCNGLDHGREARRRIGGAALCRAEDADTRRRELR